jgi:hypothetical protein
MAAHHQVRNAAGRNGVRLGLSPRGLLKANDPRRTVNDFAELSILLEVAICLDHFAEHEGPIDDRPEGARLESLGDVLTAALRRVSSPLVRRATQDTGRPSNRPVGDAAKARSDRSIQALHLMAQGTPSPINRWTMAPIILGKPRPSNEKSSMRAISMIA